MRKFNKSLKTVLISKVLADNCIIIITIHTMLYIYSSSCWQRKSGYTEVLNPDYAKLIILLRK